MRPKKIRKISCDTADRCFKPMSSKQKKADEIVLTLDEFEAIRLLDHEALSQEEVALQMGIHRSTVSRIATAARKKIAQALVDIRTLKIAGGCCTFPKKSLKNKKETCS